MFEKKSFVLFSGCLNDVRAYLGCEPVFFSCSRHYQRGGKVKHRIVFDAKAPGVSAASSNVEAVQLPPLLDVVIDTLEVLSEHGHDLTHCFTLDIEDAFWQIPVMHSEQKFFMTYLGDRYYVLKRAAQGSRAGPLQWASLIALVARLTQGVLHSDGRLSFYVDDPLTVHAVSWIEAALSFSGSCLQRQYTCDSPTGLGAFICVAGEVREFFSGPLSSLDSQRFGHSLGDSSGQQTWKSLYVLVALRCWSSWGVNKRARLTVRGDNVEALQMILQLKAAGSGTSLIVRELALDIAVSNYVPAVAEHIPGIVNVTDSLLTCSVVVLGTWLRSQPASVMRSAFSRLLALTSFPNYGAWPCLAKMGGSGPSSACLCVAPLVYVALVGHAWVACCCVVPCRLVSILCSQALLAQDYASQEETSFSPWFPCPWG